jgi:prepilin-type processing-associated H-X9-DG protein
MTDTAARRLDWITRILRWVFLAGIVAVGAFFGLLAIASPCGLAMFFFYLWIVLFLTGKAKRFAVILLVVCGFCLFNCLRISVTDPSELIDRSGCRHNLKQIALAMHNYAERYGTLPPAYIADSHGKPLHSWRVSLLPFLEEHEKEIYKRYSFDEPWDGPKNRKLHNEIVRVYACPSEIRRGTNRTMTSYVVITGERTAFPGTKPIKLSDFQKRFSDVLLIAEVADSGTHWMEPKDIPFSEMDFKINGKPGKSLSSCHGSSWEFGYIPNVNAVYADGHAECVPLDISPKKLKERLAIRDDTKGGPRN